MSESNDQVGMGLLLAEIYRRGLGGALQDRLSPPVVRPTPKQHRHTAENRNDKLDFEALITAIAEADLIAADRLVLKALPADSRRMSDSMATTVLLEVVSSMVGEQRPREAAAHIREEVAAARHMKEVESRPSWIRYGQ